MDPSARTIDEFIAHLKQSGLQLALITPTSSFIGTHLAEALLAQNLAVLCEVTPNSKTHTYTKHLIKNPNFFLLEHTHQFELPINLPAPKYIIYDVQEAINHFLPNEDISFGLSLETKRLIEYAVLSKSAFLLLAAMDPELQNPYQVPRPQDHTLSLETSEHHAQLKHFVQTLIAESIHKASLNARVVLYTDIYGPRMDLDAGSFMVSAIRNILLQDPLPIAGDGLSVLRPLYITDFIYGVIKSLLVEDTTGKTFTLVQPKEVTHLQFSTELQKTAALHGVSVDVVFTDEPAANSFANRPIFDVLSVQELVWSPKVELVEGLQKTLHFFFPQPVAASSSPVTPPAAPQTIHTEATAIVQSAPIQKTQPKQIVPKPEKTQAIDRFVHQLKSVGTNISTQTTSMVKESAKSSVVPPAHQTAMKLMKHKRLGIFLSVLCVLLGLSVLLITLFGTFLSRYTNASVVKAFGENASTQEIEKAISLLQFSKKTLPIATFPYTVVGKGKMQAEQGLLLSTTEHALQAQLAIKQAYKQLNSVLASGGNIKETLKQIKLIIRDAKQHALLAQAEYKILKDTAGAPFLRENGAVASASSKAASPSSQTFMKAGEAQETIRKDLVHLSQSVTFLEALFTKKNERHFAIVLIDNSELRPAGGVISGLFTLNLKPPNKPTVTSLDTASAALNPKLEAPKDMKNYLRQSNILFENSLWQPSFTTSISAFIPGIEQLAGKPVDGVIGIDLFALRNLLSITGPITLSAGAQNGEKLIISNENFNEQLAKMYTATTLPKGERRQAVMKELMATSLEKLFATSQSLQHTTQVVVDLARTRHLLVALTKEELLTAAERNGWFVYEEPQQDDFVGVYDTNISLNKVNSVVNRTIHHEIAMNPEGLLSERLVVTYTNESEEAQWPLGTYQTYTRVLLPTNRKVTRVVIDEKKPATPLNVVTDETGQTAGTVVTVAPGAQVQLTVEYQREKALPLMNNTRVIQSTFMKQPGSDANPYELAIRLPRGYKVTKSSPQFEVFDDGVLVKTFLDTNKSFSAVVTTQ